MKMWYARISNALSISGRELIRVFPYGAWLGGRLVALLDSSDLRCVWAGFHFSDQYAPLRSKWPPISTFMRWKINSAHRHHAHVEDFFDRAQPGAGR
jgi:hypothetical protein